MRNILRNNLRKPGLFHGIAAKWRAHQLPSRSISGRLIASGS